MQIAADLLHRRLLLGREPQRIEAHRDEQRHPAVVVMAVVLEETGRGVLLLYARARYGRGRRIGRRAAAASEHPTGAEEQRRQDPGHLSHRWHLVLLHDPHAPRASTTRAQRGRFLVAVAGTSAAVSAVCRSLTAAVTAGSDGEGVGKAVFPVIPFTIPWA